MLKTRKNPVTLPLPGKPEEQQFHRTQPQKELDREIKTLVRESFQNFKTRLGSELKEARTPEADDRNREMKSLTAKAELPPNF